MKILYVYADELCDMNTTAPWLVINPAAALYKAGYDVDVCQIGEFVKDDGPSADLIVVERLLWNGCDASKFSSIRDSTIKDSLLLFANTHTLDAIERRQDAGSKVIAVFDDHYEAMPENKHSTYEKWVLGQNGGIDMGFSPIEDFRRGIGLVNAIMTPSKFLQRHYGEYARKAYYVHNRPDTTAWPTISYGPEYRRNVVGWSGTTGHINSWDNKEFWSAMASLRNKIIVFGMMPPEILSMLNRAGFRASGGGGVPYRQFPLVVSQYDIGICPLDGEYDRGRSWIKWLECSMMGKPVVAQDYEGIYDECCGGFIASTEEEWTNRLELLLNDDKTYRQKAAEGLAWARAQSWDEHLDELLVIFEEVMDED